MRTNFLLLHGYGGKSNAHWQAHLMKSLTDVGQHVRCPEFPDPDHPSLEKWLAHLEKNIKKVDPSSLVIAAHSLGCSLWLHYVSRHPEAIPKKAFLVAPPLNDCGIPEISEFFPLPKLNLGDQNYLIIGSDNDNFIPQKDFETLANNIDVPFKLLPDAGHINAPVYGHWEWMFNECFSLID
jgi:hypothetical protein